MSDNQTTLKIASKESVAYDLMHRIAASEQIYDRKRLLTLYSECLEATNGQRPRDDE